MKITMLKTLTTLTIILFTFTSYQAYANYFFGNTKIENENFDNATVQGGANLKNIHLQSLTVHGALKFNDLKIHDHLHVEGSASGEKLNCNIFNVNGSLTGQNITSSSATIHGALSVHSLTVTNDLKVNGSLIGHSIVVSGKTSVSGTLSALNSNFKDIEIESHKATFENSNARNILIKSVKTRPQTLTLKGLSTISGDIIFESGDGIIHASKNVKISGNIKGARVIRE
jgi:cytoskeletal protein CcmA (bactofilin family)